jgi:hypothetical protein
VKQLLIVCSLSAPDLLLVCSSLLMCSLCSSYVSLMSSSASLMPVVPPRLRKQSGSIRMAPGVGRAPQRPRRAQARVDFGSPSEEASRLVARGKHSCRLSEPPPPAACVCRQGSACSALSGHRSIPLGTCYQDLVQALARRLQLCLLRRPQNEWRAFGNDMGQSAYLQSSPSTDRSFGSRCTERPSWNLPGM